MIYISHRLEELPLIADRVTVLRDGSTIAYACDVRCHQGQLIQMMVGRELSSVFPKRVVPICDTVLELRGVGCAAAGVHDVTLNVRAGEIVGSRDSLAPVAPSSRAPSSDSRPRIAARFSCGDAVVTISVPSDAIAHGIATCRGSPSSRRGARMSVSENITLAALKAMSRFGALDFRREREVAVDYSQRLGVKTPSIRSLVATLSGGNQQKVALSRWLLTKPSLLVLDEPTQGIDVGAKSEIHALMTDLAAEGVAILMISSELPEVLGMCDRIAVMQGGTIVERTRSRAGHARAHPRTRARSRDEKSSHRSPQQAGSIDALPEPEHARDASGRGAHAVLLAWSSSRRRSSVRATCATLRSTTPRSFSSRSG
jgi:rhamnose transport system ATP-binding protein